MNQELVNAFKEKMGIIKMILVVESSASIIQRDIIVDN